MSGPRADAYTGEHPATRLGVLGWDIQYSRSPAMHNAALAHLGLSDWRYQLLPVPAQLFAETVRALPAAGFRGANVTVPHKRRAFALADTASDAVRAIGAANTLSFAPDGAIGAENTDAPGLIAAMAVSPKGRSVFVLGAGGSADAAVWALRDAGAGEISVWSRKPEQASELAERFGIRAVKRRIDADILVNCTRVGLRRSASGGARPLSDLDLTHDQIGEYPYVIDFVYSDASASIPGPCTLGGLEILLAQGALSFEHWTGRPAPLDVMREAIAQG